MGKKSLKVVTLTIKTGNPDYFSKRSPEKYKSANVSIVRGLDLLTTSHTQLVATPDVLKM